MRDHPDGGTRGIEICISRQSRALFVCGSRVTHPMPDFALSEVVDKMMVPVEKQNDALIGVYAASEMLPSLGKGRGVDANLDALRKIAWHGEQLLKQLDTLNGVARFELKIPQ
jgi:hypothetical protein